MMVIAGAEIKDQEIFHHGQEPFSRRLVKSVECFQLLKSFGVKPLGPLIQVTFGNYPYLALATGESTGGMSLDFSQQTLHRSARNKLGHDKGHKHDPEKGRDHQEYASSNIGCHINE